MSRVGGREGESFISPDTQRDQIRRWAELRGVRISKWHTDLDQSGADANRPGWQLALERAEAGRVDGMVVAELSRFSRSLAHALSAIARLDEAGAQFVSIAEGIDPTTAVGKMMLRLLLVLHEFDVDRKREGFAEARRRAVARGIHIASRTPTGYAKGEDGRLVPNGDAEAIRTLFALRGGGASWSELAGHLDAAGAVGPYENAIWTIPAVRGILTNRVYLGEARSGEFVNAEAHPPIVDEAAWAKAQRAPQGPSPQHGRSLLSGLLRCAGCRHLLKPDTMRGRHGEKLRIYRCRGKHASGDCPDRAAVLGHLVEPYLEERVLAEFGDIRAVGAAESASVQELEGAVATAATELEAYRDGELASVLGPERFRDGLEVRAARVEDAERRLAEARDAAGITEFPEVWELRTLWPGMSVAERRKVLHGAVDCVFLRSVSRRNAPIAERVWIFWRGHGPDDLPARGRRVPLSGLPWPGD